MVTAAAAAKPRLKFQNFSLRCDKSDPEISFNAMELGTHGKRIAVITNNSFLYQLVAGMSGLVAPVSGGGDSVIGWPGWGRRLGSEVTGLSRCQFPFDGLWRLSKTPVSASMNLGLTFGMKFIHLIIKELSRAQKNFYILHCLFFFHLIVI